MQPQVLAAIAGLFFGIWPLLMNKSGLTGSFASLVFSGITISVLIPVVLFEGASISASARWGMAISAGIIAAFGLLAFNGMIVKVPKEQVGTMFVIMIVVQTLIPSIYHCFLVKQVPPSKIAGFLFAFAAAVLLAK